MGLLEKKILEAVGYDVKNIPFRTARRFLPDAGERKPAEGDGGAAWALAEHREKSGRHLIAIAHVHMENWGVILGSTAGGEKHDQTARVYEFSGYGGLLAYSREGITFYAMKPGERMAVPPDKERTIINLDEGVLIVASSPEPKMESAQSAGAEAGEATLEEQFGCPLMFLYEPESSITTCLLNTRYYHTGIIKGREMIKGAGIIKGPLENTAAIFSEAPGKKLYHAVREGREQMDGMGIHLALPENT